MSIKAKHCLLLLFYTTYVSKKTFNLNIHSFSKLKERQDNN